MPAQRSSRLARQQALQVADLYGQATHTIEQIARIVGLDADTTSRYAPIAMLRRTTIDALRNGRIAAETAARLATLPLGNEERSHIEDRIAAGMRYTTHEMIAAVRRAGGATTRTRRRRSTPRQAQRSSAPTVNVIAPEPARAPVSPAARPSVSSYATRSAPVAPAPAVRAADADVAVDALSRALEVVATMRGMREQAQTLNEMIDELLAYTTAAA